MARPSTSDAPSLDELRPPTEREGWRASPSKELRRVSMLAGLGLQLTADVSAFF